MSARRLRPCDLVRWGKLFDVRRIVVIVVAIFDGFKAGGDIPAKGLEMLVPVGEKAEPLTDDLAGRLIHAGLHLCRSQAVQVRA